MNWSSRIFIDDVHGGTRQRAGLGVVPLDADGDVRPDGTLQMEPLEIIGDPNAPGDFFTDGAAAVAAKKRADILTAVSIGGGILGVLLFHKSHPGLAIGAGLAGAGGAVAGIMMGKATRV